MHSTLTHLECSRPTCGKTFDHTRAQNLCTACGGPLLARYDLAAARRAFGLKALKDRVNSMWRYREVLPPGTPVTLGEGMTPLLHAAALGRDVGLDSLYVKEEGQNPTSSFKAR